LIQNAIETIKTSPTAPTIHATFLDPYVLLSGDWLSVYGLQADWSDNYFSKDNTGLATEEPLNNAFNVDVTALRQMRLIFRCFAACRFVGQQPAFLLLFKVMAGRTITIK
jgi:hypothetical protein